MSINKSIRDNSFENSDSLKSYLEEKARNHTHFKYYSKSEYISNIIKNHTVYLTNGEKWNDTLDRENLNSSIKEYENFAVCLSFSKSENVAMWMLYSGNDGCMIDYSKDIINQILNTDAVELGVFEHGEFKRLKVLNSCEFRIFISDVIYYADSKKSTGEYYVKRSDEVNGNFKKSLVDNLNFQKKTLPWSYENECRIIVSIKKELLDNLSIKVVAIKFPEKYKESLSKRVYDSPNCKKCNYQESALKSKINWNLCSDCSYAKEK